MEHRYTIHGKHHSLTVEGHAEGGYTVTRDDRDLHVVPLSLSENRAILDVDGRRATVYLAESRDEIHLFLDGRQYTLHRVDAADDFRAEGGEYGAGENLISTPMPGRVVKVLVEEGDVVQPKQPVLIIESMKMENEVRAMGAGRVVKVYVSAGDSMNHGDPAVELGPVEETQEPEEDAVG